MDPSFSSLIAGTSFATAGTVESLAGGQQVAAAPALAVKAPCLQLRHAPGDAVQRHFDGESTYDADYTIKSAPLQEPCRTVGASDVRSCHRCCALLHVSRTGCLAQPGRLG